MQALLMALITWLSANYALPANYDLPQVRFAAPREIASIRYGAFNPERRREVAVDDDALGPDQQSSIVSVYEDKTRTIVLPVDGRESRRPNCLSSCTRRFITSRTSPV